MTNKEIIKKVASVTSIKEKYKITDKDIELVLSTAGLKGKPILQALYLMVSKNSSATETKSGASNQVYKILKTKFNIS